MKLHLLNHASVLIEADDVRLLCDPWYFGTCFDGGWGLRWRNDRALDQVEDCTHLWISHFHSDHFHVPTLKKVLERNPSITVIANRSFNFQLDDALRDLGFRNVVSFGERVTERLSPTVEIVRYPATGIDNMLVLRSDEGVVLNYNDCVLPQATRGWLAKKIGPVDVFLCNFNHAGKLLKVPLPPREEIRAALLQNFGRVFGRFAPKWIVPFASHHQYRSSVAQNDSLMTIENLVGVDPRVVPLHVGQAVEFAADMASYRLSEPDAGVRENPVERREWNESFSVAELTQAADAYCRALRKGFPLASRLLKPVLIRVEDADETVAFSRRGLSLALPGSTPHLSAHSEALHRWFTRPYGTDAFVVGAHFQLVNPNLKPFWWLVVFTLLVENALDLRSILRMGFTGEGLRFLLNRREEILGVLVSRQIGPDYQQQ